MKKEDNNAQENEVHTTEKRQEKKWRGILQTLAFWLLKHECYLTAFFYEIFKYWQYVVVPTFTGRRTTAIDYLSTFYKVTKLSKIVNILKQFDLFFLFLKGCLLTLSYLLIMLAQGHLNENHSLAADADNVNLQ